MVKLKTCQKSNKRLDHVSKAILHELYFLSTKNIFMPEKDFTYTEYGAMFFPTREFPSPLHLRLFASPLTF
jgi:hypothetical protein